MSPHLSLGQERRGNDPGVRGGVRDRTRSTPGARSLPSPARTIPTGSQRSRAPGLGTKPGQRDRQERREQDREDEVEREQRPDIKGPAFLVADRRQKGPGRFRRIVKPLVEGLLAAPNFAARRRKPAPATRSRITTVGTNPAADGGEVDPGGASGGRAWSVGWSKRGVGAAAGARAQGSRPWQRRGSPSA